VNNIGRLKAAQLLKEAKSPKIDGMTGAAKPNLSAIRPNAEDLPGTDKQWVSPAPGGEFSKKKEVSPQKFLGSYYGDNLKIEQEKARTYAVKNNLPWKDNQWTTPGSSASVPMNFSDKPFAGASPPYALIRGPGSPRIVMPTTNQNINPLFSYENGLPEERPMSLTSKGVLGHELSHVMYPFERGDVERTPNRVSRPWRAAMMNLADRRAVLSERRMYPEVSSFEFTPPAAAIQRHLYKTTGKRLESPEDYDKWIQSMEGVGESKSWQDPLPTELRRWLRYRENIKSQPMLDWRRDMRLNNMDNTMRHIIPGIVQNQRPSMRPKHAFINKTRMNKMNNTEKSAATPWEVYKRKELEKELSQYQKLAAGNMLRHLVF